MCIVLKLSYSFQRRRRSTIILYEKSQKSFQNKFTSSTKHSNQRKLIQKRHINKSINNNNDTIYKFNVVNLIRVVDNPEDLKYFGKKINKFIRAFNIKYSRF